MKSAQKKQGNEKKAMQVSKLNLNPVKENVANTLTDQLSEEDRANLDLELEEEFDIDLQLNKEVDDKATVREENAVRRSVAHTVSSQVRGSIERTVDNRHSISELG